MNVIFSVIVPVYNVSIYLKKCIESILNQEFDSFELILVDDGSTDDSGNICDFYAKRDNRVTVVHKENGGLVSARISGSEVARGEYICCVDGDDWVSPFYFRSLDKVVKKYSPDIISFGYVTQTGKNCASYKQRNKGGLYSKKDLTEKIYPILIQDANAKYFIPSLCAKAIRAEIYKKNQQAVNKQINIGEDAACSIPCVIDASTLYILKKDLYYYRCNETSMTKKKRSYRWNSCYLLAEHLKDRVDFSVADFQSQYYRYVEHAFFNFAVSQFYNGKGYLTTRNDILSHMEIDLFKEAISNSKFGDSPKARFMDFCLKNRMVFPLWLYSRIK